MSGDPYNHLNHAYQSFYSQNPNFVTGGHGNCWSRSSSVDDQKIGDYGARVTPSGNRHVINQYLGNSGLPSRPMTFHTSHGSLHLQSQRNGNIWWN